MSLFHEGALAILLGCKIAFNISIMITAQIKSFLATKEQQK